MFDASSVQLITRHIQLNQSLSIDHCRGGTRSTMLISLDSLSDYSPDVLRLGYECVVAKAQQGQCLRKELD